jgi:PDZ domain-containing protein
LTILYSGNLMFTRYGDRPAFPGERIVIVPHPLFTHRISKGYEISFADAIAVVNGFRIRKLPHLVEVIRDAPGESIEFTFQGRATHTIVFSTHPTHPATSRRGAASP